ncbi:MAG TPA: ABC transporter substrate-binding protein [Roseomonas sp.]|jgi:putative ABC transport system substrate-binding protein
MLPRRTLLAAPALAFARPAAAQQQRPYRILMMLFRGWEEACDGFRDYFAARRIPVELIQRDIGQDLSRVPALVAEARAMRPDLVYIWGTSLAIAALGPWDAPDPARYLTDLPVVFNIVTDPVGNRIVQSREASGRLVTGTEYIAPVEVQMRAMARYRAFTKVATTFNPNERNSLSVVRQMRDFLGGGVTELPVALDAAGRPDPGSIPGLVAAAKRAGAEWLYIPPDTFLNDHRLVLTQAALQEALPCFSASERFVQFAEGLAGLVSRYYSVGAFTGFKAEQILRGGRAPGSIPVETLTRFSFLIRMETARRLALYPPVGLLRVAETV